MSKFKVGDLALLLMDVEQIKAGSVVELLMPLEAGRIVREKGGDQIRVLEHSWAFYHGEEPNRACGFCPERYLMPLRGDFQPEQKKAKEEAA
ncbi:hypothetical protein [Pseudomonas denitrificans (nom. rej.)]|uniref:Uncharacterized protein n=1 Tax=Pseudomonas denitrificans TaxID=43306 RepID=A0A9X7MYL8_PSEDE|nr:hypothetical protein [Pseudomonas denitrificans (nom. rej.)]QEY70490.1 hypothetical protein F1C79_01785 [Pseudomonas denitrificans (nom. rej.)]